MAFKNPFTSSATKRMSNEISLLQTQIKELREGMGASGLGVSSLDGTSMAVKDTDGNVRQVIGIQLDGRYSITDKNGPIPPTPTAPILTAVPGGFIVKWDGNFLGGAALPSDYDRMEIHVELISGFAPGENTRDVASILKVPFSFTFAPKDIGSIHYVKLVCVTKSGTTSIPSAEVAVTPPKLGQGQIAPNGVGTVQLDDGAVVPIKSATGVTANIIPDPGFNEAAYRVLRTLAPWGFTDGPSSGFTDSDWIAYCGPQVTPKAYLDLSGKAGIPVIANEQYYFSFEVARSASGAGQFCFEIKFYDSTGAEVTAIAEDNGADFTNYREISTLPTSSFLQINNQLGVPPKAAKMTVRMVRWDQGGSSAGFLYVDKAEAKNLSTKSATNQARVETSPFGVIVYDDTGTSIGSITPNGGLSAANANVDDSLVYQGTEIGDMITPKVDGEVARYTGPTTRGPSTTSEVKWIELPYTAKPGRTYKIRSNSLSSSTGSDAPLGNRGLNLRYTTDGSAPTTTSPILTYIYASRNQSVNISVDLPGPTGTTPQQIRLLLTTVSYDAASHYFTPNDGTGLKLWVQEAGVTQSSTGGNVAPAETGTAPPTTTVKSFTNLYQTAASRSYNKDGLVSAQNNQIMYQGYYDSGNGDWASLMTFNITAIRNDLSGATIKKFEIFLYAEHWYYNSGGTVKIGTSSATVAPSSYPFRTPDRIRKNLPKPGGSWFDLGSVGITIGNEIRDGSTGSFTFDSIGDRNLTFYGKLSGTAKPNGQNPAIRITYEKAV